MATNLPLFKFSNKLTEFALHSLNRDHPGETSTSNELTRALVRPWNRQIDWMFYNVDPKDEEKVIDHGGTPQGSIILLLPDHNKSLHFFPDAVEFFEDPRSKDVGAISVAGVGSSAVGAVGLARDVANATGLSVAAVVSGYGLDDVVYAGLGGWFFLREVNQLEFVNEQLQHVSLPGLFAAIETWDSVGAGPDLATVKSLLRPNRLERLQWVVGHSKGNLVISGAISELLSEGASLNLDTVNVALFGALTALPPGIGRQYQFIGSLDVLGLANSRLNVDYKLVVGAMHHLNRRLPFHMNALEQLKSI